MTFGGVSRGMTPDEVLTLFLRTLKNDKKRTHLLEQGFEQELKKEFVTAPKEKYFIENERRVLEHAALPYRVQKSFNEGMRDLEKLAIASSRRWEEVGEGMWIFDPASSMWNSLGGKIEVDMGRVRHNFLPYDISQLSEKPILCHVHPEDLSILIAPREEELSISEYKYKLTKFLTATPSRADYGLLAGLLKDSSSPIKKIQAAIIHSLGTTMMTIPKNIETLEEMSEKSRDLRDQVMLEFDTDKYSRGLSVHTESDY